MLRKFFAFRRTKGDVALDRCLSELEAVPLPSRLDVERLHVADRLDDLRHQICLTVYRIEEAERHALALDADLDDLRQAMAAQQAAQRVLEGDCQMISVE
jgi:hypothetical protein